jgi:6-phosphogluconolactonase
VSAESIVSPTLFIHDNPEAAAEACGARIFELLGAARRARGAAYLAVSGGSTPRIMFEWMARQTFGWNGIHLFQVDERCVPPDHELSNFRMMREALLSKLELDAGQVHRIAGESDPATAAAQYEDEIRRVLRTQTGEAPVFDVIHRGMGGDAHTASLFPGEPLIADREGVAAAVWNEKLGQHRVTLLPAVLEAARHSLCLACGADKAEALWNVLRGERDAMRFPSQIAAERTEWFIDRAAAGRLAGS